MDYIIGVDGGGTKTEAIAYSMRGEEVSRAASGFANVLVDAPKAIGHILEAVRACIAAAPSEGTCRFLGLGLAGIDSGKHRDRLEQALQESFSFPYQIVNDARLAHAAALQGKDGILTIAGTGSVAFGLKAGDSQMTGAWGHLLGDEGSGYWIVMEAFRQMIREEECDLSLGSLSRVLMERLAIKAVPEIKRFVYGAAKGEIAALVPAVVETAGQGDAFASSLLRSAGKELAEMTLRLYRKQGFAEKEYVPIALKGSILTKIPLVQEAFLQTMRTAIPTAQFVIDEGSAAKGAYYLALQQFS
ncbi:N-acetylglucosamine kinase [Brevibacillus migulae]|uniref:N-acetylglucosamine kinase n=1 Tax=Brevibacillus migulae TaxID=1644114 RepID=UPI00106ED6A4|nr:BadF/BadG/BcrA/BcrD ATPase family protein [Brevibacillus migulae]